MMLDIRQLEQITTTVFNDTPIQLAYAYGSRVHGRPRPDSDLDIGYYLPLTKPRLSVRQELALAVAIGETLGVEVDLRDLRRAPLELRGRILEQGKRVYCADDVARVSLERDTLSRYHDYKPEFAAMHRLRLQRVAQGAI